MEVIVLNHVFIKTRYKILFILFVVLGLYYPSIFSGFNSVDDSRIISYLEDTDFNLFDIVIPGKSHYYRPVIWLTYFFDKYAWGLEPSFMHLENIVIHAVNAVLVYTLAIRLSCPDEQRLELPLFAALLFAVHPINTEAICWVAGRTDPLATFFVLIAACYLAGNNVGDKLLKLMIPATSIFFGCLVKEVAFFFFPIACLAAVLQYRSFLLIQGGKIRLLNLCRPSLPFILFPLAYLYLRQLALSAADKSVSILVTQKSSMLETSITAFKAFGFYVKKLFFPLPLNFAIVSYSNLYALLGIAVILIVCLLFRFKRIYYNTFAAALFLIIPAVIVAVKPIAWTPVAERYLYASTAFFVIAFVGMLYYLVARKSYDHLLPIFLVLTIIIFAFLTVQRNLVWQDNFLLYKDAVTKSPQFNRIRNDYGIALLGRREYAKAFDQFETGHKMNNKYVPTLLNPANTRFQQGRSSEALELLKKTYKSRSVAVTDILKLEARVYESLLFKVVEKSEQKRIILELIDIYHYIDQKEKNPYLVYRSGQLLLFSGEPQKAAVKFERAYKEAPDDAFYKQPAKKLADKLKAK